MNRLNIFSLSYPICSFNWSLHCHAPEHEDTGLLLQVSIQETQNIPRAPTLFFWSLFVVFWTIFLEPALVQAMILLDILGFSNYDSCTSSEQLNDLGILFPVVILVSSYWTSNQTIHRL